MHFSLGYELHEHGWASAVLRNDEGDFEMTASYLRDTLRELAIAAYQISRGESDQLVVFMDEPGEHQLRITQLGRGECSYSVDWYEDWQSWGINSIGSRCPKRITEGVVSSRRFRQQVHTILWSLYRKFGIDGYKSRWCEHDFPKAEMERLAAATQC